MKQLHVLFCLLFLAFYDAKCQMYGGDWMGNLFDNINRMTGNLEQNIMSMNQRLQTGIRQQVRDFAGQIQQSAAEGQQGMSVGIGGNSYVVSSVPGSSQSVISGYDADGQLYYRQSEDRVVGSVLYHNEKIYSPSRGTTNEFRYTLDLTDPNARPIVQEVGGPLLPTN